MPLVLSVLVAMGVAGAPGSAAAERAEPAEEKQVCKRVKTMETGSTIRQRAARVCRTASEWKAINAQTRQKVDSMKEQRAGGGGSPR